MDADGVSASGSKNVDPRGVEEVDRPARDAIAVALEDLAAIDVGASGQDRVVVSAVEREIGAETCGRELFSGAACPAPES